MQVLSGTQNNLKNLKDKIMNNFWDGFEKQAMTAEQKHKAKFIGVNTAAGASGAALGAHLAGAGKKGQIIAALGGGLYGAGSGAFFANKINPYKRNLDNDYGTSERLQDIKKGIHPMTGKKMTPAEQEHYNKPFTPKIGK
jgi:hypothetical protein